MSITRRFNRLKVLLVVVFAFSVYTGDLSAGTKAPLSAEAVSPLLVGSVVPDVDLNDINGKKVSLGEIVGSKPAVLIFYRGGWCPICSVHLMQVQSIEASLQNEGYQVIAISPDRPAKLKESIDKKKLGYTLLSDSKMSAALAFGIAFKVDDRTIEKYTEYGIDLEKDSGEDHHLLPVPAVFIIGGGGKIVFEYVNPDYKTRIDPELLLEAARVYSPRRSFIEGPIRFTPVEHASFVINAGRKTIYVDPVGDISDWKKFNTPDLILLTDIHGDHLDQKLVTRLKGADTVVVGPKAVIDRLSYGTTMVNREKKSFDNVQVEAVPMYNTTKDRLKMHAKGRGNGYLLTLRGKKVYISGDTEDIKEMRTLEDIDYAFVCMNLPYTMTVDQAASAVLEFKPAVVFPYHYRGKDGFSDIKRFKKLVSASNDIEVRFLNWYK